MYCLPSFPDHLANFSLDTPWIAIAFNPRPKYSHPSTSTYYHTIQYQNNINQASCIELEQLHHRPDMHLSAEDCCLVVGELYNSAVQSIQHQQYNHALHTLNTVIKQFNTSNTNNNDIEYILLIELCRLYECIIQCGTATNYHSYLHNWYQSIHHTIKHLIQQSEYNNNDSRVIHLLQQYRCNVHLLLNRSIDLCLQYIDNSVEHGIDYCLYQSTLLCNNAQVAMQSNLHQIHFILHYCQFNVSSKYKLNDVEQLLTHTNQLMQQCSTMSTDQLSDESQYIVYMYNMYQLIICRYINEYKNSAEYIDGMRSHKHKLTPPQRFYGECYIEYINAIQVRQLQHNVPQSTQQFAALINKVNSAESTDTLSNCNQLRQLRIDISYELCINYIISTDYINCSITIDSMKQLISKYHVNNIMLNAKLNLITSLHMLYTSIQFDQHNHILLAEREYNSAVHHINHAVQLLNNKSLLSLQCQLIQLLLNITSPSTTTIQYTYDKLLQLQQQCTIQDYTPLSYHIDIIKSILQYQLSHTYESHGINKQLISANQLDKRLQCYSVYILSFTTSEYDQCIKLLTYSLQHAAKLQDSLLECIILFQMIRVNAQHAVNSSAAQPIQTNSLITYANQRLIDIKLQLAKTRASTQHNSLIVS